MIEKLKGEKLQAYIPIYVDRETKNQEQSDIIVHLFPSEVINKQIELSTAQTAVMYKPVKINHLTGSSK